jgi:hypothetical protein
VTPSTFYVIPPIKRVIILWTVASWTYCQSKELHSMDCGQLDLLPIKRNSVQYVITFLPSPAIQSVHVSCEYLLLSNPVKINVLNYHPRYSWPKQQVSLRYIHLSYFQRTNCSQSGRSKYKIQNFKYLNRLNIA